MVVILHQKTGMNGSPELRSQLGLSTRNICILRTSAWFLNTTHNKDNHEKNIQIYCCPLKLRHSRMRICMHM